MNNLIVFPIILPLFAGLVMVIFRKKIIFHKVLAIATIAAVGGTAFFLLEQIRKEGIQTLQAGDWPAPFGISFVADSFSGLLVLTTSIVSLAVLLYSFHSIGEGREKHYFYPLFLFLLTGVNGSFLTGDIFNLFVMFEVMLVSSYVLISLGGEKLQLRESLKYILVNVLSSSLFLVAVAYLYRMVGTLNMAHLSIRVQEAGVDGLMITVAFLFLVVFALKAALFLFFWLPGSYSAPPTAVAALFAALLTKVGIYAIMRVFSLIFFEEPQITHLMIGVLAALTMLFGAIGAIAYWDIKKIMVYNVIVGVGLILAGFASFTDAGLTGSVYYFVHDMIIKALIFLIGGTVIHLTGTSKVREISGLIRLHPQLGWMFFIAALALAGIPPLSGFVGKLFITEGTFSSGYYWLGGIGLITSLMVLYSMLKIFMNCFWGYTDLTEEEEKGTTKGLLLPIGILTGLTIALGLGAEAIYPYVELAVETLLNPDIYVNAVFGNDVLP